MILVCKKHRFSLVSNCCFSLYCNTSIYLGFGAMTFCILMIDVNSLVVAGTNMKRIPDSGVSTAILNATDISRRWCKLNFGPQRGQVKSRHFPEQIDTKGQYFYFLYKCPGIIGRKRLGRPFRIMTLIYYYLLNGIILDLDLNNSCWIRKKPNFGTNIINNLIFHTPQMV